MKMTAKENYTYTTQPTDTDKQPNGYLSTPPHNEVFLSDPPPPPHTHTHTHTLFVFASPIDTGEQMV